MKMAMVASRQLQGRGSRRMGLRMARQSRVARMAYSVRWQHLRMAWWMASTCAWVMCGKSQCRRGSISREECVYDLESLEPKKIKDIHARGTSQYLKNERVLDTVIKNYFGRAIQS